MFVCLDPYKPDLFNLMNQSSRHLGLLLKSRLNSNKSYYALWKNKKDNDMIT